jgi:DNA gyrase subunit A
MKNFGLSEIQSKAILEMRLRVLTGLERDKIKSEYEELMKLIDYLRSILNDEGLRMKIIKDELIEIRDKYGDERKSEIVYAAGDFKIEDMIADEDVVITISHMGYIKRTMLSEYRTQARGGKGAKGSNTRDEDFIEHLFTATTHNYLLLFTEQGRCFWMRAFEVPEGNRQSKGRAIQNLINIPSDDKVKAYINVKDLMDEEYTKNNYIIMCTKNGIIKKTTLEAYSRPRTNGINAITVRDGDTLLEVLLTNGTNEIMLASKAGKVVRFNESKVRPMGRNASGVRGISLGEEKDNEVIGMIAMPDLSSNVMVVSEKGYGKRSDIEEYRVTNRGGKGVKTINITEKTGNLIAIKDVTDKDDLMIINKSGIIIRLSVAELRVIGRATQGVRLINLKETDEIAAVTKVDIDETVESIENSVASENPENSTEQYGNEESSASDSTEDNAGKDVDTAEPEI